VIILEENKSNTNNFMSTAPIPIMNYFIIILVVVLLVVGITPIPIDDQEKIKEASRVIAVILSIICVLFILIMLCTPSETETLNNTSVV
jgi:hypothetical protein